jgi:hypothetical protein
MPKPRWTTPVQRTWLEERIPAFNEAQENGVTSKLFYPELYAEWDKTFDPEPPSAIDLEEAEGDLEKAKTTIKKFMETVSFIIQGTGRDQSPTDMTI